MKLKFKNLKQQIYEVEVNNDSESVLTVKQLIEKTHGIDHLTIKLMFNKSILDDKLPIKNYSIKDGDTVVMMTTAIKAKKLNKEEVKIEETKTDELGPISHSDNLKGQKISKSDDIDLYGDAEPELQHQTISKNDEYDFYGGESQEPNYDSEIGQLLDMGFDFDKVTKAITFANGNYTLALDYLTNNSIPEANPNINRFVIPDILKEPNEELKKIASIVKVILESDENKLESVLNYLERKDPKIHYLINENQNMFQKLIRNKVIEEDLQQFFIFVTENPSQNPFTDEQIQAFERIRSLGFPNVDVFYAFVENEMNEEETISYLLGDKMLKEDEDEIEVAENEEKNK